MIPLIPLWLRPWQRNATRCVRCHTATQCACEHCRSVSPPNDSSKNRPAADHLTAALGDTGFETRINVYVVARVASSPTTCT